MPYAALPESEHFTLELRPISKLVVESVLRVVSWPAEVAAGISADIDVMNSRQKVLTDLEKSKDQILRRTDVGSSTYGQVRLYELRHGYIPPTSLFRSLELQRDNVVTELIRYGPNAGLVGKVEGDPIFPGICNLSWQRHEKWIADRVYFLQVRAERLPAPSWTQPLTREAGTVTVLAGKSNN